jgi:hypothetical protein
MNSYIHNYIYMNYYLQIFIRISETELLLSYMNLPEYAFAVYNCIVLLFTGKVPTKQRAEIISEI